MQESPKIINKHILFVEDDVFLCEILNGLLRKAGFNVTLASDGSQAIARLKEFVPDIVLLDLILPNIGGFAVLKQIKADERTASVPVIILSNLGSQDDIQRGFHLGASAYLIKSSSVPEEIIAKIKEVLKIPETADNKNTIYGS